MHSAPARRRTFGTVLSDGNTHQLQTGATVNRPQMPTVAGYMAATKATELKRMSLASGPCSVATGGTGGHVNALALERRNSTNGGPAPAPAIARSNSGTGLGARGSLGGTDRSSSQRKSFGTGRGSSASSFGTAGLPSGHTQQQQQQRMTADTRRLDKPTMALYIKNLVAFLLDNGYNGVLTPKQLLSPNRRTFIDVFQFIYRIVVPTQTFDEFKFEEDVPRLFRELRYPYKIQKSDLFCVGSQHAWPPLLCALHWLAELAQFAQRIDVTASFSTAAASGSGGFDDGFNENQAFFDFLRTSYAAYLRGAENDQMDALGRDLANAFGAYFPPTSSSPRRGQLARARIAGSPSTRQACADRCAQQRPAMRPSSGIWQSWRRTMSACVKSWTATRRGRCVLAGRGRRTAAGRSPGGG